MNKNRILFTLRVRDVEQFLRDQQDDRVPPYDPNCVTFAEKTPAARRELLREACKLAKEYASDWKTGLENSL